LRDGVRSLIGSQGKVAIHRVHTPPSTNGRGAPEYLAVSIGALPYNLSPEREAAYLERLRTIARDVETFAMQQGWTIEKDQQA
jgi:hypothetical protein